MSLLNSIGFYAFGLLTGALFWEGRWRLKIALMEKLADKPMSVAGHRWLTDDNKQVLVIGASIVFAILSISIPLFLYHKNHQEVKLQEAVLMSEKGYEFKPYRGAGWYTKEDTGENVNQYPTSPHAVKHNIGDE